MVLYLLIYHVLFFLAFAQGYIILCYFFPIFILFYFSFFCFMVPYLVYALSAMAQYV